MAVVAAVNDKLLYVFSKKNSGWQQQLKFPVEYDLTHCLLVGDTILGLDINFGEIYLYTYDEEENVISTLQDTIEANPEGRALGGFEYQIILQGTTKMITNVDLSEEYLVFCTQVWTLNYDTLTPEGEMEGVHIYRRQDVKKAYTFHQFFNSSDYEENFGWELAFHRDVLVLGGGNHTYVFSQQADGYFEESFRFDETYDVSIAMFPINLAYRGLIILLVDFQDVRSQRNSHDS